MYEKGDKVVFVNRGAIDWEFMDWTVFTDPQLVTGATYTVSEAGVNITSAGIKQPYLKLEEDSVELALHPDHFKPLVN